MALILASYIDPLPILDNYTDSLLGVLPEYRSVKSLSEKIIDTDVVKVVKNNSNEIVLTLNYPHLKSKTYTIGSSIFKARTRYELYMDNKGNYVLADISDIQQDSIYRVKLTSLKQVDKTPIAKIYFHDSATQGYVLINRLAVSNETFTKVDRNTAFTHLLLTDFPSVQDIIDADLNKKQILLALNELNSIVSLEQQVDLLTTLVSNLINSQEQPAWAANFLSKVATSNVTTVRSATDIITDLDSNKKKIRAAQKTYLDNK